MALSGPLLIVWLLLLSLTQVMMLWKYVQTLNNSRKPPRVDCHYPPALAILCLRGADPFLSQCIRRLLDVDYPNLTIRIVVDSDEDPSIPVVQSILDDQNDPRVELMILQNRLPHCSGKVSGLLYATESLPENCEMVAWIDGDSLLHRSALKELAESLNEPGVGAVSGNRWYLPPEASLSGLTRMLWNGFAVPAMNLLGVLWGGCMATRADEIQNPDLRKRLAHSFIEDSTVASFVRSHGRKTQMVASAILLNRESISLGDYYRFATRQLFTVRIDNSRWPWVAFHMLTLNITLLLTLVPMAMPWLPWWKEICAAYLLLMGVTLAAVPIGHHYVKRTLTSRGEIVPPITLRQWVLFPIAVLMPNQLNLLSTINTFFIRQLTWRGITYRFGSNPKCTIVDVKPMATRQDSVAHTVI
jgi:cellulose synthase/poly-beta-1,6-N-acetylglucosamine synthase-like glycosyltransferase